MIDFLRLAVDGIGQARNQEQRHGERTQQRITHGEGHRREELFLDTLEGEERHIGHDDDQGGEEDGFGHQHHPVERLLAGQGYGRILLPQLQDRLHHHNRAIHQDAEVDGAQAEQIGRNAGQMHQDESHQQGDRNGGGHDERTLRAAQEDEQDADDQQHTEQERVLHGTEGRADQVRAVHEGTDLNTFRKPVPVEFVHHLVDFLENLRRVLVTQHLHDALHAVGKGNLIVDITQDTLAFQVAVAEQAQVAQEDGDAVFVLDHDVAHILQILDQAHAADHVAHVAHADHAAAGIGIVVFERLLDIGERQVVFQQALRVDFQLVLRRQATEVAHGSHALNLLQGGNHGPLVDFRQFTERLAFPYQYVAVDLAGRRSERIEFRNGPVGQVHVGDALADTLAGPVVFRTVLEHEDDDRQAEGILAAHHIERRDAVERPLQRDGDLLFDFFGGQAGHLGHDLHRDVGDVGIGVDGKPCPGIDAEQRHDQEYHGDEPSASEGETDESFHGLFAQIDAAVGNDGFSPVETGQHALPAAVKALHDHLGFPEVHRSVLQVHELAFRALEYGRGRNRQDFGRLPFKQGGHEHPGLEEPPGIVAFDDDGERTGLLVKQFAHIEDDAFRLLRGIEFDVHALSGGQAAHLGSFHVGRDPDLRQVSHGHRGLIFLVEIASDDQVAADDAAGDRCDDPERFPNLRRCGIDIEKGEAPAGHHAGILGVTGFGADLFPFPVGEHSRLVERLFSLPVGGGQVGGTAAFLILLDGLHIIGGTYFKKGLSLADRVAQPDEGTDDPAAERKADFGDAARFRADGSRGPEREVDGLGSELHQFQFGGERGSVYDGYAFFIRSKPAVGRLLLRSAARSTPGKG